MLGSPARSDELTSRITAIQMSDQVPKDFLDVASRGMVDMRLKELVETGTLRRLDRGLYHHPRESALLPF